MLLNAHCVQSIVLASVVDEFNFRYIFAECSMNRMLQRVRDAVIIGGDMTTHRVKACNLKLFRRCVSGGHEADFINDYHFRPLVELGTIPESMNVVSVHFIHLSTIIY